MVDLAELRDVVEDTDRLSNRWAPLPAHLGVYRSFLRRKRPNRSSLVIALPYSQRRARPDWAKIVAISRFRIPFSVVEELSRLLAPAVVEMGVLPLIMPLAERELSQMEWRTPIVRDMADSGYLLFSNDGSRRVSHHR
jgi:hypothetical protein